MNKIKPIGTRCIPVEVVTASGRLGGTTRTSATEGKRDCAYPEEAVLGDRWLRASGVDR